MIKLLNKIKLILYKLRIKKIKDLNSKLEYIRLNNFSIYNSYSKGKHIPFIAKDIVTYIAEINYINNYRTDLEYIRVKAIDKNVFKNISLAKWCTNDGKLIDNDIEVLNKWCLEAELLLRNYKNISKDVTNCIPYVNSVKIKPYIINIEYITNGIFEIL